MSENLIEFQFNKFKDLKKKTYHTQGGVVWFFGLSGSGKSTISNALSDKIAEEKGYFPVILDGDNVRKSLCSDLGFKQSERKENLRRVASVAKIMADQGHLVLATFITPLNEHRELIKEIVGENLHFVFVDCPFEECEKRDPKGLYKKAREGKISSFTGHKSRFEQPNFCIDWVVDTSKQTAQQIIENLYSSLVLKDLIIC